MRRMANSLAAALLLLCLSGLCWGYLQECDSEQRCVQLALCGQYLHYVNEPPKYWPPSVRDEALRQLCDVQKAVNGSKIYYICCNRKEILCGVTRVQLIAYGQPARAYAFPWMALLETSVSDDLPCGGSLISDRHILTAAHCVKARKVVGVRVGVHDLNERQRDCDDRIHFKDDEYDSGESEEEEEAVDGAEYSASCGPPAQRIPIETIVTHPKYSARSKRNDLAIIRLQYPAIIGYNVIPICLPLTEQLRAYRPADSFVTGWGLTETGQRSAVLRYAILPALPLPDCAMRIKELDRIIVLDDGHLCAGGNNRTAHCHGDSGGPLQYVSDSTRFVLQGVVSFGVKTCGTKIAPGVFANVTHFIDWIVQEANVLN
uniref:Peptidase S1 domain-containing protein n=1 Tax=Anopheles coluzzii TaxID=1518534 RepID=A0A6E8VZ93_ANOCL|nr:phenoloxidase-activating factor 3-like [Anopheles coluzzii]